MRHSLRTTLRMRLTLLYVALLFAVLVLYGFWISGSFLHNLMRQLDLSLDRDIGAVTRLIVIGPDGNIRVDDGGRSDYLLEIWSKDGALLYRSPRLKGDTLGSAPSADDVRPRLNGASHSPREGSNNKSIRLVDGTRVRVTTRQYQAGNRLLLVRLGVSENALWHDYGEMTGLLVLGLPAALFIAGFTGYFVARRALRPVSSMAHRAEMINAERLSERLVIENPDDELGHLGNAFNETLARLERSFEQLRRFTADASHELRTPLTAMRSVGEVALQESGDASYYREIIGSMLEETNRLTHLVEDLLNLSRADAGHILLHPTQFPLFELARESAALLEILAEEKNQTVTVEGDQSLMVSGDRLILRQALVALIDNAVKYSPRQGKIRICIGTAQNDAAIEVRDSGPGIPPEHRDKIFERFYRVDKARTREEGGTGLGLSIADWAVRAHGGRIELECDPGSGCTFCVRLPKTI